jgi:tetratricopeptide (TPR) repeat protein
LIEGQVDRHARRRRHDQVNVSPQQAIDSALTSALRHYQAGHFAEAERLCRSHLARGSPSAAAWQLLGAISLHTGRCLEAAGYLERAAALRPRDADICNLLGVAYLQLDRLPDAIASLEAALRHRSRFADAHCTLGIALVKARRGEEAIVAFREALRQNPDLVDANFNLAGLLVACQECAQAIAHYREVVRFEPNNAWVHAELGRLLMREGRTEEALPFFHETIRLESRRGAESYVALVRAARNNIGLCLVVLRRWDEALAYQQKTLMLAPQSPDAHYNLSHLLLLLGRLDEGFAHYQWRWQNDTGKPYARPFRQAEWQGEDIAGSTLLIHDEQGLGDTLQFCRYVPLAAGRCRSLHVEVQPELVRLLKLSLEAPGLQIVPRVPRFPAVDGLPETDYQCPLMSLPRAFGTTLATIPAQIPYLHAEPAEVAAWSQRLSSLPRPRVGLVWAGRRANTEDHVRSIAPDRLAPLAAVAGVSFVSLQKRDADTPAPPGITLHDFTAELRDMADTAALVTALDLVIAVDTAVAHLAGALGKPVWLMNRRHSEWRWLIDREDSPWYPTLRLFRQPRRGDWESVIERVAGELQTLVAERFR